MTENEKEILAAALNWKSLMDKTMANMKQKNITMDLLIKHDKDKLALNSAIMRLCNALNVDAAATEQEPCGFTPKLVIDNDK